MHEPTTQSTADILRRIASAPPADMTLETLIAALGERSFGLAILVLATPNIIPFLPGFASLCAVPMTIIAVQMMQGYPCIRLPRRFAATSLSAATITKMLARCIPLLTRMERWVKPRLHIMSSPVAEKIIGLLWCILAFVMFLPIPLGDPAPSLCAALLALGMLEKDGILIMVGAAAALLTTAIMSFVIAAVLTYMLQWVSGFLH